MYNNNELLRLYGFKNESTFVNTFNKKMTGGNVMFAPPSTSVINASSISVTLPAYKRVGRRAPGAFGSSSRFMIYPIYVNSSLIPGIGPTRKGMPTN